MAVLQRLWPKDRQTGKGIIVCVAHLRASADDGFRMQQASELVTALQDFSRGDEQIILADVNSIQTSEQRASDVTTVYDYFVACGYTCVYASVGLQHGLRIPNYTTWAGWASGDFKATCDHIFVSQGVQPQAVLDVPEAQGLATVYPERLPNASFPSDHMSLLADLIVP